MERLIPYAKMSKKEKKAYNEKRRVVWQFSPVTRKKESAKAYSRKEIRRETRRRGEEEPVSPCFFALFVSCGFVPCSSADPAPSSAFAAQA